jgi:hypothetical protein
LIRTTEGVSQQIYSTYRLIGEFEFSGQKAGKTRALARHLALFFFQTDDPKLILKSHPAMMDFLLRDVGVCLRSDFRRLQKWTSIFSRENNVDQD